MPSLYDLKPRFQNALRPLVCALADGGVSANQVTLAAVALSCATGSVLAWFPDNHRLFLLLPPVLLLRMALNAIDGMLAREHDMITPLGAVLNELGDAVSDVALYLPFAWVPGISPVPVVLLVIFALLTELSGVVAVQIGARRRYDGPFGKSDRALLLGALALLLGLGVAPGAWSNTVLLGACALAVLTVFNRVRMALRQVAS
ncbi:MAG: CDP-alcohol phosphatidyltransferase family protein [Gammaproteobacteria bacterium]|nr:CDP-alcohol phosphatidyltransferase family protein [Gammaproteobacteria bacterium]MCP5423559.1 CDP-alcohol phosphatidyltransferase family protein [Gammaproteobacteria bacterium]